jgi:hypothetical protein
LHFDRKYLDKTEHPPHSTLRIRSSASSHVAAEYPLSQLPQLRCLATNSPIGSTARQGCAVILQSNRQSSAHRYSGSRRGQRGTRPAAPQSTCFSRHVHWICPHHTCSRAKCSPLATPRISVVIAEAPGRSGVYELCDPWHFDFLHRLEGLA